MIYILLNLPQILAATGAGLAAGVLFLRFVARRRVKSLRWWATAALAEAWLAAILAGALILAPAEAPRTVMALLTPVVIWAGFVLPAILVAHTTRGLALRTAGVDALHVLVVAVIQAVVLHTWGLEPPPR
ncbi:MAG: DUF1761 domain-containing protein [Sphingomonadaceae bacterium]|uniref:hypothetical protein n=1 Tax=Thermaurantiacus sp. TaxID=2820283 RepID=UPI00298EDC15|nr:hypothetical protein [Thermaurantiacus sp.]MCS6987166.1 DUF1761 domain-containing protein [Sphingomonadaceae bacterium]MDW8415800.1 hypothetical protein [Thermaurantiacus sp.]